MSLTENQQRFIEALRKRRAEEQAEEEAILMPPDHLAGFRRQRGISQSDLAQLLSKRPDAIQECITITPNRISEMERGKPNRALQLIVSRYFRSLGYETDKTGDFIHIERPMA